MRVARIPEAEFELAVESDDPPTIEEEIGAHDGRPTRGSGNPMDL